MKLRLEHPAWRRLAASLARGLARVSLGGARSSLHGDPEGKALLQSESPVIFALWHGHLLSCLYLGTIFCRSKFPIVIMASPSRDGAIVGDLGLGLGYGVVPGSRHKGGFRALQNLTAHLQQGESAALTADGSRGPIHVAQKGVLYLSRETQAPILPIATASSRKITLNTWDRFEVPLPLGQNAFLVDAPIRVGSQDRGAALEKHRQHLEARLNHLFHRSQNLFRKP
jgi:lysophospholipid acyltransferase (LPLAT)-like uncharacterized protein